MFLAKVTQYNTTTSSARRTLALGPLGPPHALGEAPRKARLGPRGR